MKYVSIYNDSSSRVVTLDDAIPGAVPVSDSSASSFASETIEDFHRSIEPLPQSITPIQEEPVLNGSITRRISFGDIEIRKYPVILGDHPDCEMGPPVTIDWEPFKRKTFSIDRFEELRGTRRSKIELKMGWIERKHMLKQSSGASDESMHSAAREAQRVRDRRHKSRKMQLWEWAELPIESLGRKFHKLGGRHTSLGKKNTRNV